jgi:hypothetical protein
LVSTLYNSLAVTRVGRLDDIRTEAERLVDEAFEEQALRLSDRVLEEAWPHERDERENELIYKIADLINEEAQKC